MVHNDNIPAFKDISDKSDWVLQPPCVNLQKACGNNGEQNRTRTCSIEPENNEESLNEVSPDPCELPTCHYQNMGSYSIQGQRLIGQLPARPDASKSIFRDCIFTKFFCRPQCCNNSTDFG